MSQSHVGPDSGSEVDHDDEAAPEPRLPLCAITENSELVAAVIREGVASIDVVPDGDALDDDVLVLEGEKDVETLLEIADCLDPDPGGDCGV